MIAKLYEKTFSKTNKLSQIDIAVQGKNDELLDKRAKNQYSDELYCTKNLENYSNQITQKVYYIHSQIKARINGNTNSFNAA